MPVFGLNNGMVPIVAYNYGARKPDRIMKTMRLSIIYAVSIMIMGFAVFQIVPESLLAIFDASEEMVEIGVPALRIISFSFLGAGFGIVSSSVFQALGHGMLSLIVSVLRQLIVILPVAWILARVGGLHMVWWAFPIAEIFSAIVCFIFVKRVYRKEIRPLYK